MDESYELNELLLEAGLHDHAGPKHTNPKAGLPIYLCAGCFILFCVIALIFLLWIQYKPDVCETELQVVTEIRLFQPVIYQPISADIFLPFGSLLVERSPDHYIHLKIKKRFNKASFNLLAQLADNALTIRYDPTFLDNIIHCRVVDLVLYLPDSLTINSFTASVTHSIGSSNEFAISLHKLSAHLFFLTSNKGALIANSLYFQDAYFLLLSCTGSIDSLHGIASTSMTEVILYDSSIVVQTLFQGGLTLSSQYSRLHSVQLGIYYGWKGEFDIENNEGVIKLKGDGLEVTLDEESRKQGYFHQADSGSSLTIDADVKLIEVAVP
ncbi:hypothetical protein P9112_004137 [Eukaryota sp. TZLM1-RC]